MHVMLKVFNTLSGREEIFEPLDPKRVTMYVCGPTVYDDAHIGHGRAYVSYDVIVRYLRHRGFPVTYVRNITDIDDKIIARANERGEDFRKIAEIYAASFHHDMDALGLLRPDVEPKASEVIPEIVSLIETLLARGKGYLAGGDAYFSVASLADYGKLSKRDPKELKAGARVDPGEKKRDPLDFALWKGAKPGEPSWSSPFGPGRPAWHIECSAMTKKFLGESIDIHAGGRDLIFPHHENEIAQSEGASGKTFVKYWLHNGFVNIDRQKMSKSLGNSVNLKTLLEEVHPEALKIYLLATHYRAPFDFSDLAIREAARGLDRIYRVLLAIPDRDPVVASPVNLLERFEAAMDEDFNTAKALAALFDAVREANRLSGKGETLEAAISLRREIVRTGNLLGLLTHDPAGYFQSLPGAKGIDRAKIEEMIAKRNEARRQKDFAASDRIRADLAAVDVVLEDGPDGTTWRLLKS
jgi:cysteinyl-tRNA synthetase